MTPGSAVLGCNGNEGIAPEYSVRTNAGCHSTGPCFSHQIP